MAAGTDDKFDYHNLGLRRFTVDDAPWLLNGKGYWVRFTPAEDDAKTWLEVGQPYLVKEVISQARPGAYSSASTNLLNRDIFFRLEDKGTFFHFEDFGIKCATMRLHSIYGLKSRLDNYQTQNLSKNGRLVYLPRSNRMHPHLDIGGEYKIKDMKTLTDNVNGKSLEHIAVLFNGTNVWVNAKDCAFPPLSQNDIDNHTYMPQEKLEEMTARFWRSISPPEDKTKQ